MSRSNEYLSLAGRVGAQAEKRPEARAIITKDRVHSYSEIERDSNRLAHALLSTGAQAGDRVALVLQKSPEAIIAMLACLKAGMLYVPIDPGSPALRAQRIMDACEPAILLTHGPAAALATALHPSAGKRRWRVGWLDEVEPTGVLGSADFGIVDLYSAPDTAPPTPAGGLRPAHILFTSGSTGTPKGVVVGQPSILTFIDWANDYFKVQPGDRHSGHSPLHFDLSTFDIFGTLSAGAELHLVPAELNLLAPKLAKWIRESELTQWFSVPSILTYLVKFDAVAAGDFPSLKRLLWCGEVLPTPTLRALMHALPHVTFTNLYGPTEATIASSYYTVPEIPDTDRAEIPIGQPCGGEALHLIDGELYISGDGLALGYWNDPETTAKAFLSQPEVATGSDGRIYKTGDLARVGEDGLFYFLGRADSQIKSRGYRIELGEIEAALATMSELRESVVVALPSDGFEGWTIACAFTSHSGATLPVAELRKQLGALIPAYMIPSRWAQVASLPRTSNGKADRRAVKELFEAKRGVGASK
jgi:amino acid adenylation domain-containing protein